MVLYKCGERRVPKGPCVLREEGQDGLGQLSGGLGTGWGGRRQEGSGRRSGRGRWALVTGLRTTLSEAWRGQDSMLVGYPAKGN